jgi:antitoxin (DNA-binding transcriptional repressor) of toxin-antitoxin stability system
MKTNVEAQDAQDQFFALLELAKSGTEVIISEGDAPVARLTGVPQSNGSPKRVAGLHKGSIAMSDDFDEPLPESFWTGEL